ncbi:hypothetical protein PFISCL1PPCAC_22918 [Pristionchus fissidentatus]|uniref:Ferric oxidoreductase domain-containing protein n=1 Tax=Pristionchus fissidentatus TaxID=1538716 RepID=A0AAV5WH65_9BILA|nr:hypothetical protein PFISCL1PPCAC_22918 [Pristionchus fissidentatus]
MCLLLHLVVAIPLLLSSLPITRIDKTYLHKAQVASHAVLGLLLVVYPSSLLAWTVDGDFKDLHSFMQSYIGVFHLSVGLESITTQPGRPFIFARLLSAFFCLFTRLFAAWHLSEKSTRGLLISTEEETVDERLHHLCAETTRCAEGKNSSYLINALYVDASIAFCYALFHFAFPQNILKIVIKPNIDLDSHHYMWCRLFGALWLMPALGSLAAVAAPPAQQLTHLLSRLIVQVGIVAIHVYGHWILAVFSPNHITAFMVAGFFMSFHISTFYRYKKAFASEPKSRVSAKVEIKKVK